MRKPSKPFVTDGCSGGMSLAWKFFTGKLPPWEDDCIEHDRAYWTGGTKEERWRADVVLLINVITKGYPSIAMIMYLAVRVGGHPYWPLPWRWACGHPYVEGRKCYHEDHT